MSLAIVFEITDILSPVDKVFVANDINNVSNLLDKKNILKSSKLDLPISTFFNL